FNTCTYVSNLHLHILNLYLNYDHSESESTNNSHILFFINFLRRLSCISFNLRTTYFPNASSVVSVLLITVLFSKADAMLCAAPTRAPTFAFEVILCIFSVKELQN